MKRITVVLITMLLLVALLTIPAAASDGSAGTKGATEWLITALISVAIGAAVGGIVVLIIVLRYRRKSRSPSYPLRDFTSLTLTREQDIFLGKSVVITRIQQRKK